MAQVWLRHSFLTPSYRFYCPTLLSSSLPWSWGRKLSHRLFICYDALLLSQALAGLGERKKNMKAGGYTQVHCTLSEGHKIPI